MLTETPLILLSTAPFSCFPFFSRVAPDLVVVSEKLRISSDIGGAGSALP